MRNWGPWVAGALLAGGLAGGPTPWAAARSPEAERPAALELSLAETAPGRRDVLLRRDRGCVENVTRFTSPQHVYDYRASPDGAWLVVWHMARPPRQVSIYRAADLTRVARFAPGFGGELAWTPHGTLLHQWGAGPGVRCWQVLDRAGRRLLGGDACGLSPSPDRALLAEWPAPSLGVDLVVRDTRSGEEVYRLAAADLPPGSPVELAWVGPRLLEVRGGDEVRRLAFGR